MPRLGERYARALITGASSGLGRAFSDALLGEGLSVWGTSRSPESLEQRDHFFPVGLDLAGDHLEEWFEKWDRDSGGFDLVINNAGFAEFGAIDQQTGDGIAGQMQVLLTGPVQLARVAIKHMRKRGAGCLVNVSSVAGDMWIPYLSVYDSAKAGLSAFSQALMLEDPNAPPWVVDFRPGDFRTAFNERMFKEVDDEGATQAVRGRLDQLMQVAPDPEIAARDLLSAIRRFRHCTRYSGSFVQTSIASMAGRLLPNTLKRKVLRRFYKVK